MKLHRYFLPILLLVSPLLDAAILVSMDRNPVHVNESFQLFFDADESPDEDPDFSPLQQHFVILNTSQNSSISIINGDYQRSIKWTLQLMPKQVGEVLVPAIQFGADKTEPFQVSVKPASQSGAGSGSGLIFELSADRESVAVQGQVIITMRMMSDTNITAYEFGELVVDNVDVVTETLGEVKRFQTRLGDKAYLVLEQKFALFPQISGNMRIKPVLGQVRLSAPSRSVFDPFQTRGEVRSVYSPELKVEVTGIEPVFSGQHWLPSSNLRLSEVWQEDFDKLVAGEPITRTIMMVADGLTAAQLPALQQADISGLKQYPDQAVLNDQRSEAGIVGLRQQKIALIPTTGGTYTLPEISIPWWNINTAQQEMATIPARTIRVAAAVQGSQSVAELAPAPAGTVAQPSTQVEAVEQGNRFWIWFSLFLAIGWIVSVLAWWWNRRKSGLIEDGSTQKQMSLNRAAKALKQACKNNDASAVREALLYWASALDISTPIKNLNQLGNYFGEPLKTQIDSMNQSLYGTSGGDWQGDTLYEICQSIAADIEKTETGRRQSLPALNP